MNIEEIAKQKSDKFLKEEQQYRLGFVESEQPNPITTTLGETFVKDTKQGVKMLLEADRFVSDVFFNTVMSNEFDLFYQTVKETLLAGNKIVISGCGSTGRLAMRIESSWREAISKYSQLNKYADNVISLMTGGDYAIIRSVESFEDYIQLGAKQAQEVPVKKGDLLIGVTATGETTSVLGTASYALNVGAKVYMVVCTKPESIINKLERAKIVYGHENCRNLYFPCGGMAVTGSTRMQSSSLEQAAISVALEMTLASMLGEKPDKKEYAGIFKNCVAELLAEESVNRIAAQIENEEKLYNAHGHVTYFADEYLLDVLADTTERGPTFTVPHFRPQSRKDLPLSWAFVKNPCVDTVSAWKKCFGRTPRCIDKTAEEYEKIGISTEDTKKIPKIDLEALYEFQIGNEPDPEREQGESLATWVDLTEAPCGEYREIALKFNNISTFSPLYGVDISKYSARMKIFEHLAMKLSFNIMSTGTMARMLKIRGNYMVCINISNKKLIDRATRIISDLCKIDYEKANYELFLTKEIIDMQGINRSPAEITIERLGVK